MNKQLVAISGRLNTEDPQERQHIANTLRELMKKQYEVLNTMTQIYAVVDQSPEAMKAVSDELNGSLGTFIQEILEVGLLIRKYIEIFHTDNNQQASEENPDQA